MIGVQDLRKGTTFLDDDGNLFVVLDFAHNKQGRGNATINIKARNLRTGANVQKSYQSGGRVQDVRLETKKVQYLYKDGENYVFMDQETYEQPQLSEEVLSDHAQWLKEGTTVELLVYEEEPLDVELPTTVDLVVTDTAPSFKGNTASGGGKPATLETGAVVQVPFFVNTGDTVRVNTESGEYLTRV
jgi:elongation factor P